MLSAWFLWFLCIFALKGTQGLDTWLIPYQRKAISAPGNTISAPLSTCQQDFSTTDADECFTITHDQASGLVNVTVNCCMWNDYLFKGKSVISANPFRCEITVCEPKKSGQGVEIVSKHPVFTEGKQMSGCCLKDGVMYKPGASFYDPVADKTLVCCSGNIYGVISESPPPPPPIVTTPEPEPVTEESELLCPSYKCGEITGFQCNVGKRVVKLEVSKTQYALFPSLIHQKGFSMHMYGGRESLKRDCHGHYFFASNIKLLNEKKDLSIPFMGLERKHHLQGFLLKFTPTFRQAWATMIEVDGGVNPLIKDTALDSIGYIFALITYEKGETKMMRIQKYDQCGNLDSAADLRPGTFISREAFLGIDSNDDVIAFHSFSVSAESMDQLQPNPCHLAKMQGSQMDVVVWEDVIETIEGESSCMPTGISVDCQDNIYSTGFMGSSKGFVRKYNKEGEILWTLAQFGDQVTEMVYDPREDVVIVIVGSEKIVMVSADGEIIKEIEMRAREVALGDEGYFAFHWLNGEHKIGYLTTGLELIRNYDISWKNWNDISWCDNLVPSVYGKEVYLTCSLNDAQDVIIFQTKLGDEKTFLGAKAEAPK